MEGRNMDIAMGLVIGIGLSAACGFRVFVPLLGLSIASLAGHLTLSSGFEWIGSWPALVAFATATIIEVCAYYIPWFDHIMDVGATPAAIVVGTVMVASQMGDMSPLLKWSLAALAGGGVSAVVQGGTVALRAASLGTTGGLGNWVVSTLELGLGVVVTVLAIVLPVICLVAVALVCYRMAKSILASRLRRRRQAAPA
jgi:phosphoglycerol transferase MdoB-like AlkP superfamily enzyme